MKETSSIPSTPAAGTAEITADTTADSTAEIIFQPTPMPGEAGGGGGSTTRRSLLLKARGTRPSAPFAPYAPLAPLVLEKGSVVNKEMHSFNKYDN